jgi:hypothetical protein
MPRKPWRHRCDVLLQRLGANFQAANVDLIIKPPKMA